MYQKRIFIPTDGPESWRQFLAEPKKHWRSGFSAMSTAYSWENSSGIPHEILKLFLDSDEKLFHDATLAFAIPEYKVGLKGGNRPSQNDVFAILTCTGGLITVMVEGKAKEDFDVTLGEWKKRTSEKGGKARLADIMENIGLTSTISDDIRYQLLHRTASAVIEARRFHAPFAAVIIQSFVTDDGQNHYQDFCKFVKLFGEIPIKEKLLEISNVRKHRVFAAWVQSGIK